LGDKRAVFLGFALMILGGALMAFWTTWNGLWTGRILSGFGGVLLNVLLTKMATDWFAAHRTATAMAIFINAWPVGIAASLLVLPALAAVSGVQGAFIGVTLFIVSAWALFFAYLSTAERNCRCGHRPRHPSG
jgi:MFS family permease